MNRAAKRITMLSIVMSTTTLIGCGGDADTTSKAEPVNPTLPVSDWELVWSDEFDSANIDLNKWTHEVNCLGGGNNEKQCYTDSKENSYIADGKLQIVALPAAQDASQPYTSARLNSRYKADFKYGRFEMNAKLPSGQGSWPAFWLMPTDEVYGGWPRSGEIDIVESVNLNTVNSDNVAETHVYGTLHYGKASPDNASSGKAYQLPESVSPADGFHTYAIEWQEGEIRWYVDDYLYATQRRSDVRKNSKGEAVGLAHRGWFSEYFDATSGELTTFWDNSPYDQEFYMILNQAVGGNWPENVNNTGIDAQAYTNGNHFEIDYIRVYQCKSDPLTGKGCETIRAGYDSKEDALVEGKAPIPSPPSTGVPQSLTIFGGEFNANWPAWDCCGGSTPALKNDTEKGDVVEFSVGAEPTVNGFITREAFITDESGKPSPFDASPVVDTGSLSFDMKVVSLPNAADAPWIVKVESNEATTAVEVAINSSTEGELPAAGIWQTYTFPLKTLADGGLDLSAIDVVMIFPAWGQGEGAVYQVANMKINTGNGASASPKLTVFDNAANPAWPAWDCCGGSMPTIETLADAHEQVTEFSIGASPTVMGFISRAEFLADGVSPAPFDASSILSDGVISFEMNVVTMPNTADAPWLFKVESNNGETPVELALSASVEGVIPVQGVWQTYTFELSDLADAGLDVSAIDVLMIFPAWGQGEGAVYHVDNVKIYNPNDQPTATKHILFADSPAQQWSIWDCCAGSTPTVENDDTAHGMTAEFVIGASPTVMGILADDDVYLDASSALSDGVVQFEMKVVTPPNNSDSVWMFKIESGDASAAVELALSASNEGAAPVTGQWQTYTYSLQALFDAGLDISQIDVVMVFPAWGTGEGAVYRLDNVIIGQP